MLHVHHTVCFVSDIIPPGASNPPLWVGDQHPTSDTVSTLHFSYTTIQ